ncbi:MAG: gamma-glutamyltransferase [Granulosicoccaceae bacterium]
MACTSHPLASQAAIDILKAGGNALDGAIAAAAVQGVVEPGSTGIGGDCFCLYAARGRAAPIAFNGSGKAPQAATAHWYAEQGISRIEQHSPHAVTTPGAVDAWVQLNRDHGALPLAAILEPAIRYAREGFPVSSRVHFDWSTAVQLLAQEPHVSDVYLVDGRAPAIGQMHRFPEMADALELIAREGRVGFYEGELARVMAEYLAAKGGLHSFDDFRSTHGVYVDPISANYLGREVFQCPPNGQGVIALLLLNIMQGQALGDGPLSEMRVHTELEACRLAYAARNAYVADPVFAEVPLPQLLSIGYARQLASQIDQNRAVEPPREWQLPRHNDTVYISVVDKDRNVCSFINTLFHGFGSGLMAPNSGVLLQNRGQGFSLQAGHPNEIAPGKRPMHTIIPGMLAEAGKIQMSYGVMGGEYQAFGHMQFLSRHLEFGFDLQEAMDLPRFMVDPFTGEVEVESGVSTSLFEAMQARGHRIVQASRPIGGSQAISIDWEQGVLTGASDPRKDGCAIGY